MSESTAKTLLWGGRFTEAIDDLMFKFNESLTFDKAMCKADIQGSITYARGLQKLNLITEDELNQIISGFEKVEKEWDQGTFPIDPKADADIHTANERRLSELIGAQVAGKLHTGRSRNDQVATDMRLWAREQLAELAVLLKTLLRVSAAKAKDNLPVLMPGYTHLQRAQPVRFSHWLLGHATFLIGDLQRLEGIQGRGVASCPLGVAVYCVKTVSHCLTITSGVVSSLKVHGDKMKAALTADMLATDVADYLVLKGVPFRQTHHIAGAVVRKAEELGVSIAEVGLEDLKQISPLFEADIAQVFDFEKSVERRSAQGGTSRSSVLAQTDAIEKMLS
ncbi:hypothetical protein DL769_002819 [Monosporascus sp. CRB-8-3]|nr:hypothetical protein DL769_002819 [Monosporascus sp. CRB-8-3]